MENGSQHALGNGFWVAQRHGRVRHYRCRRENTGEVDGRVSPRVTGWRSDVRWDAVERAGPFTVRAISSYTLAAGSLLYVVLSLTSISYTATRRVQVALGIFGGMGLMYITAMLLALSSRS